MGYRRADARDHRIKVFQWFTLVVYRGFMRCNIHVGAQYVDHDYFMATLFRGLDNSARRIELSIPRKKCDFHLSLRLYFIKLARTQFAADIRRCGIDDKTTRHRPAS